MIHLFISNNKHTGLRLMAPSEKDPNTGRLKEGETLAKFNSRGDFGVFTTEDDKLAETLKRHPLCGEDLQTIFGENQLNTTNREAKIEGDSVKKEIDLKGFSGPGIFTYVKDGQMPNIGRTNNLVHGAKTSVSPLEREEIKRKTIEEARKENVKDAVRFGILQNKLLKNDGTYRADANEEEKNEYEKLKEKFQEE